MVRVQPESNEAGSGHDDRLVGLGPVSIDGADERDRVPLEQRPDFFPAEPGLGQADVVTVGRFTKCSGVHFFIDLSVFFFAFG